MMLQTLFIHSKSDDIHANRRTDAHTHRHTYKDMQTHGYTRTYTYTFIQTHRHIYIHAKPHAHTHSRIRGQTQTQIVRKYLSQIITITLRHGGLRCQQNSNPTITSSNPQERAPFATLPWAKRREKLQLPPPNTTLLIMCI